MTGARVIVGGAGCDGGCRVGEREEVGEDEGEGGGEEKRTKKLFEKKERVEMRKMCME